MHFFKLNVWWGVPVGSITSCIMQWETERMGHACMLRYIKESLWAGGKINSCRRGEKQVWFECICCPLFLKALQTLALQSAPITGALPADYMQWSRVHIQHGLYMLALTTGARSKQCFSDRSAKNFSHQDRESQAVSPGDSGPELLFLMYTVSGTSSSPHTVQRQHVGRGRERKMGR